MGTSGLRRRRHGFGVDAAALQRNFDKRNSPPTYAHGKAALPVPQTKGTLCVRFRNRCRLYLTDGGR